MALRRDVLCDLVIVNGELRPFLAVLLKRQLIHIPLCLHLTLPLLLQVPLTLSVHAIALFVAKPVYLILITMVFTYIRRLVAHLRSFNLNVSVLLRLSTPTGPLTPPHAG